MAKYTAQPVISIDTSNSSNHIYTGIFETTDTNEKVYNYRFIVYDSNGDIFEDSGELIHNSTSDVVTNNTTYISNNIWTMKKNPVSGEIYSIQYFVKTLNNLKIQSVKYNIQEAFTITPPIFNGELSAILYPDNGYIELFMVNKKDYVDNLNGQFVLSRASSEGEFNDWNTITNFTLANNKSGISIWKDFTIK